MYFAGLWAAFIAGVVAGFWVCSRFTQVELTPAHKRELMERWMAEFDQEARERAKSAEAVRRRVYDIATDKRNSE